jgi:shikimate dehydrogenase
MMLVGVIGWPVGHSKSPAMHNAAASELGLDLIYLPLAVEPGDLEKAVSGLVALGFRGVNVTVPHKEAVMAFLDEIDPAAQAIGAVNTIVVSRQPRAESRRPTADSGQRSADGGQRSAISGQRSTVGGQQPDNSIPHHLAPSPQLFGYNTDWQGFMADLEERKVGPQIGQCLILGAGGGARAVAYGLASAGNPVHVFARRMEQAQRLAEDLGPHCPGGELTAHHWQALDEDDGLFTDARLIVNCTPVGMAPDIDYSPWPKERAFPASAFVYDLIYNPAETMFLQQAKSAGCKAANGLGMLVHQGALAFQLWTGKSPDLQTMVSAIA